MTLILRLKILATSVLLVGCSVLNASPSDHKDKRNCVDLGAPTTLAAIASLVAIFVNTIALFSIYQPEVFFHELAPQAETKLHLRSIELSPEAAKQLDEQLQALVKNHKPHLDEDISLPKLASLLGVTSHQLSELLNIHKSTSFYDFLNDLRYQESLHFLATNENELTIADIAYRSGFNNRNSFYKVFKEKTGLTPNQYKKSISQ